MAQVIPEIPAPMIIARISRRSSMECSSIWKRAATEGDMLLFRVILWERWDGRSQVREYKRLHGPRILTFRGLHHGEVGSSGSKYPANHRSATANGHRRGPSHQSG